VVTLEERFRPEKELAMATRNKLSEISARMESLERTSVGFRKRMTTDFVSTITKRFEDMERSITELGNKIDDYRIQSMGLQGQIDQTNIRINQAEHKRLEEREMEAALKELAGAERPKVDKRLLEGLKK
jgi:uncharacterized coiled-coil DUF342 family protein